MKKKMITCVLAATMAIGMLAGCGDNNSGSQENQQQAPSQNQQETQPEKASPVMLTYMTQSMYLAKAQDEINEEIQKAYPHISLEISHVADNYETMVKTKFAGNDAPDLFDWNGYLANKPMVDAGYMVDITDDGIHDGVLEAYQEAGKYNDRVYGIPTFAQASGLIYNKQAFEEAGIAEPPKTFSELKEATDKLNAVGIIPFATGIKDVWVAHQLYWNVAGPNTPDFQGWYDDMNEGKTSFRTDAADKGFELMEIVMSNTVNHPLSSDNANQCFLLANGEAGMMLQGVWSYAELVKNNPDVELGLAPIPASENPDDVVMEYEAQGNVFISTQSKHIEDAKNVLRWFTTKEGVETIASLTGEASPMKVEAIIELNTLSADADKYVKSGGKTVGFIKTYWLSGMTNVVGKEFQTYVSKNINADGYFEPTDAESKETFFNNIDAEWAKLYADQQ